MEREKKLSIIGTGFGPVGVRRLCHRLLSETRSQAVARITNRILHHSRL